MMTLCVANPFRCNASFASFVVAGASIEIALSSYAVYTWFVESVIGAAARGLELMLEHALAHDTRPPQLPTYDQLETLGLLDFREHGDPRSDLEADDLVAVLSTFGIEPSPDGAEVAEVWTGLWRESMSSAPSD